MNYFEEVMRRLSAVCFARGVNNPQTKAGKNLNHCRRLINDMRAISRWLWLVIVQLKKI